MLRLFNLTILILALLVLQGCTKTVEVLYGEIKPELRLKREDIVNLELEQLKEKYLGKEVSVLKSRYGGCGHQMGIANACSSGFGLKDTDITDPDTLAQNTEIDIEISLFLNYTLYYHQRYVTKFGYPRIVPDAKLLKDMIFIKEAANQEACRSKFNESARRPSNSDKPWIDCELSQPDLAFSGRIFNISKSTSDDFGTTIYLQIIPIGLSYSYQANSFFD